MLWLPVRGHVGFAGRGQPAEAASARAWRAFDTGDQHRGRRCCRVEPPARGLLCSSSRLAQYLKNVVLKYIESQVPSEKEQLVPVIATLLSFSPQEHQKVLAAHSKANDEGAGLFGGVFSLFGGGAAATPPPKPLAAPSNFKPSPTTANATGAALGSKDRNGVLTFGSDDEDFATPLNPFAT